MSTTKTNLFAGAKKKETPKTKEKGTVIISEKDQPGFSDKLKRLETLRARVKADGSEAAMLELDIKAVGTQEWLNQYEENKCRPESFKLCGELGGKLMLKVIDKYVSVPDEKRAEELQEQYGEKIVTKKTEYTFNGELLEKYMEKISDALSPLQEHINEVYSHLPEDERPTLIQCIDKFSITEGTVEKLVSLAATKEERMTLFFTIQPQVQLAATK